MRFVFYAIFVDQSGFYTNVPQIDDVMINPFTGNSLFMTSIVTWKRDAIQIAPFRRSLLNVQSNSGGLN